MKYKISIIITLLLSSLYSTAQNTYLVKSKAILIGSIEDTVFRANSKDVICIMENVSDMIIITFPANSFKTNIPEKDSLLNSFYEHEIKIEFMAEDIFEINDDILNSKFKKTVGELNIGDENFEEPIEYKIEKSPYLRSNDMNSKRGLTLTVKCDFILDKYFKNEEDNELFSPILEIEVIQATINIK